MLLYELVEKCNSNEEEDIKSFIGKLSDFLDQQTDKSIYILANDTNLGTLYAVAEIFLIYWSRK